MVYSDDVLQRLYGEPPAGERLLDLVLQEPTKTLTEQVVAAKLQGTDHRLICQTSGSQLKFSTPEILASRPSQPLFYQCRVSDILEFVLALQLKSETNHW